MLPKTMSADYKRKGNQVDESEMERSLSLEDYPVILYCHGNSYDRDFVERAKMKDVGASTSLYPLNNLSISRFAFISASPP